MDSDNPLSSNEYKEHYHEPKLKNIKIYEL